MVDVITENVDRNVRVKYNNQSNSPSKLENANIIIHRKLSIPILNNLSANNLFTNAAIEINWTVAM